MKVSDLSPLSGLTQLMTLYLGRTWVSNVSPLSGLTNLEYLYLTEASIRPASLKALREARPKLEIKGP